MDREPAYKTKEPHIKPKSKFQPKKSKEARWFFYEIKLENKKYQVGKELKNFLTEDWPALEKQNQETQNVHSGYLPLNCDGKYDESILFWTFDNTDAPPTYVYKTTSEFELREKTDQLKTNSKINEKICSYEKILITQKKESEKWL